MINTTPLASNSTPSVAPVRNSRPCRVVRCEVVAVQPESPVAHDLLPWADPYIASLMAKLQREGQEV